MIAHTSTRGRCSYRAMDPGKSLATSLPVRAAAINGGREIPLSGGVSSRSLLADLRAQQTTLAYRRVLRGGSHDHDVEPGVAGNNRVDQRARCATEPPAKVSRAHDRRPVRGVRPTADPAPRKAPWQDLVLATARPELRHRAPRDD